MTKPLAIHVDRHKFVFVDGIRICRLVPEAGAVEFYDKDKRRSALRGGRVVRVRVDDLFGKLRGEKGS